MAALAQRCQAIPAAPEAQPTRIVSLNSLDNSPPAGRRSVGATISKVAQHLTRAGNDRANLRLDPF